MSTSKPKEPAKQGWYRNEKGEICYEGKCFGLAATGGKFEIAFDDQCDVDEVAEGEKALLAAALSNNVVFRRRRKEVPAPLSGEPEIDAGLAYIGPPKRRRKRA